MIAVYALAWNWRSKMFARAGAHARPSRRADSQRRSGVGRSVGCSRAVLVVVVVVLLLLLLLSNVTDGKIQQVTEQRFKNDFIGTFMC